MGTKEKRCDVKTALWTLVALVMMVTATARAADPAMPERWNYIKYNLMGDEGEAKLIEWLTLSKECGCTHILLGESRMARLVEKQPDVYYERAEKVQKAAKDLGLKLIPIVFHVGYGGKYLYFGGNLMAGLPVRSVPFVVKGGTAEPDPASAPPLANGGFEEADGDKGAGWDGQKFPGTNTFIDTEVKHSGKQSLRISNLDKPAAKGAGAAGVSQTLKVKPFQYYRVSLWGKWDQTYPHLLNVNSKKAGRNLTPTEDWFAKPGPDGWARYEAYFNTLNCDEVTISLGLASKPGNVWIDDVKVEPGGLMLIVRRDNVPLVVTTEDAATTYKEGDDFKPVFDSLLSEKPFKGELDHTHKAAAIELTPNSRIKEGQRVLVSYYHTLQIGEDQHVVSIQEPKLLEIMENDIRYVVKYWPSTGYMMNYDEIRMGGWEPNPGGENLTPGQILARHVKKGYDLIRKYDPKAEVYAWSDMLTPYHNARPFTEKGYYWMVNGNWDGSWEGLPKDVIIQDWYAPGIPAFKFFADRGHRQVMCGYYDVKTTDDLKANIHKWMTVSKDSPGVLGLMYTTWKSNYKYMKEYFQLADTYSEWSPAMPAPKLDTKVMPLAAPAPAAK